MTDRTTSVPVRRMHATTSNWVTPAAEADAATVRLPAPADALPAGLPGSLLGKLADLTNGSIETDQSGALPIADRYVVSFEDHLVAGYLAEEVEALLESERFAGRLTIYRIHRIDPSGRVELVGVHPDRFELESGMFFFHDDETSARATYDRLSTLADASPPPGRARLELAQLGNDWVVACIHPSEHEHAMGRWLNEHDFAGGDWVEGGISAVTDYERQRPQVLAHRSARSESFAKARSREQLLADWDRTRQAS